MRDVLAQARAQADEMLAAGTTTFECKSGYGLSPRRRAARAAPGGRARPRVAQRRPHRAARARGAAGHTADSWMDEVEAMLPEVLAAAASARSTSSSSRSRSATSTCERMGELRRDPGLRLRCHVEQLSTMRSVPVALAAGARSVDHLSRLHPDDVAPLAAARLRRGAAARRGVHERRAPRTGAGAARRRARSSCSRPTSTPAPRRCSRCRS